MSVPCKDCSKCAYKHIKKNIVFVNKDPFFVKEDLIHNRFINSLFLSSYLEYFNYIQIYDKDFMDLLVNKFKLCPKCHHEGLSTDDNKKQKYVYIRDGLSSYQYNRLVNDYLYEIHNLFDGQLVTTTLYSIDNLENQLRVKLEYLRNKPPTHSFEWKGADVYYYKLFKIPRILYNLNNLHLREHYYWRPNEFSDSICGHPKASHGWFYDSVNDLLEKGIELK